MSEEEELYDYLLERIVRRERPLTKEALEELLEAGTELERRRNWDNL